MITHKHLKKGVIKYCFIALILTSLAWGDIVPVDVVPTGNHLSTVGNLLGYFDIFTCKPSDVKEKKHHKQKLNKMLGHHKYLILVDLDELVWSAHTIREHTNIVFFSAVNSDLTHIRSYNIAYNQKLDEYYLLKNITIKEIKELLGTESFDLRGHSDYLKYAFLIATLKNSPFRVRMIANIADLYLSAVIMRSFSNKLDGFEKYEDIKLGLPKINQGKDGTDVTFYMARKSFGRRQYDIVNITVTFNNHNVIDYKQEMVVANCFEW